MGQPNIVQRLLFVDDDAGMHTLVDRALAGSGIQVCSATSAERALELLEREAVQVLISDQHMPGMQGSTLVALVAKRHPNITRILLTAKPSVDVTMSAINSGGVFRFLAKPFHATEFVNIVHEAMAEHERRRLHSEFERLATLQASLSATRTLTSVPSELDPVPTQGLPAPPKTDEHPLALIDDRTRQQLSKRELEILDGMLRGHWVTELAQAHGISPHTVRNHIKAIYRKTGVHSQAELLNRYLGHRVAS